MWNMHYLNKETKCLHGVGVGISLSSYFNYPSAQSEQCHSAGAAAAQTDTAQTSSPALGWMQSIPLLWVHLLSGVLAEPWAFSKGSNKAATKLYWTFRTGWGWNCHNSSRGFKITFKIYSNREQMEKYFSHKLHVVKQRADISRSCGISSD